MGNPTSIGHILVVEDLARTRTWLVGMAAKAFPGAQCRDAGDIAAARALLKDWQPDLALIDLGLPDGDGTELIRWLAGQMPQCLNIVSTIHCDDQHLFPVLRAGASGYLLKDRPEDEQIGHLVGLVEQGAPALSPSIAQRLLGVFRPAAPAGNEGPLTPRETEVLRLIAKGYSIEDVSHALELSANTVSTHLKNIYRKLSIHSRAEASMEAVRLGLLRPDM